MAEVPEIQDVRRVSLKPGDFLVARMAQRTSASEAVQIRDQLRALFRWQDVVVTDSSVDLDVLAAPPAPETAATGEAESDG